MGFFFRYIPKYGVKFSIAVFFVMCEAAIDLLMPTIMAHIIDVGVAARDFPYILRYGALMLFITLLGAGCGTARNILSSQVSFGFGADLRLHLYEKIQRLSLPGLDQFERATLITRLTNDTNLIQQMVHGTMRIFLKAPILCIGSLIMATRLNSHLAVVLAVVVPLVCLLIALNMRLGFPLFRKVQAALDKVNGITREYLAGVRVVKAFHRFDYEEERFQKTNEELCRASLGSMRMMTVFGPAIMLTVNFGIIAVLWLGNIGVRSGNIQPGQIIAFVNYMSQILFSLMLISGVFVIFVRAKASAARISEVLSAKDPLTQAEPGVFASLSSPGEDAGTISFQDVSFQYPGMTGPPVLRQITFTSRPGQTIGIIGSTGAGKTSLLHLIPRFYDVTAGTLSVGGLDVRSLERTCLRQNIALVPQKVMLFSGTIMENLRWGNLDATPEEVEAAARIAAAHDFVQAFPEGYNTRLGQGGVNLSGGQKQRLSIARALLKKPAILLLDDATSAVDVHTEEQIRQRLKTFSTRLTCLFVTQRITSVMGADQILVLDKGRIVGLGNHAELLTACPVYQEIFHSQIGKEAE